MLINAVGFFEENLFKNVAKRDKKGKVEDQNDGVDSQILNFVDEFFSRMEKAYHLC